MLYSNQQWFCNICGQEQDSSYPQASNGSSGRGMVCSRKCAREFRWRETLSIMNKPYKPDPEPYVELK